MIITASPPRRPNRNRRVLTALAVWLGLAAVVFTWAGIQNVSYRGQLAAFTSDMRTALDAAPSHIQQAKESGDAAAVAMSLTNLSATLSQKTAQAPKVPTILGLQIGIDAEAIKYDAIITTAKTASDSLKQAADFIDFQSKLARTMQELSLKDVSGYEQTIGLANAWKDAANTLQHASKPPQLTDVAATLLQKMIVAESRIRELAELYKQGDNAGFIAKQKELAAIIDEIKPLGTKIGEISAALDNSLQRSFAALRQNL